MTDGDMLDETEQWWEDARLRTIMTEPRRHELILATGKVVRLDTGDFMSVSKFATKFLDAVGSFPPMPDKGASKFLRILATRWFAGREEVEASADASDRGTLLADVRSCLRGAPETEEGIDLERGAIVRRGPAGALFVARALLDRVRRGCPVKFTPAEFYAALHDLGCENLEVVRVGNWRGRVWVAPLKLIREPEETVPNPVTLSREDLNGATIPLL